MAKSTSGADQPEVLAGESSGSEEGPAHEGNQAHRHTCQFAEYLYRFRGIFCWKGRGFQGEGGDATTSGGIMAG